MFQDAIKANFAISLGETLIYLITVNAKKKEKTEYLLSAMKNVGMNNCSIKYNRQRYYLVSQFNLIIRDLI